MTDWLGRPIGRTDVSTLRARIGYLSPALAHEIPEQLTPRQVVDAAQAVTLIGTLARIAAGPIPAIVTVLHRVEDIPPGFTHALLVRDGCMLVAGPMAEVVVTDEPISACSRCVWIDAAGG